MEKSIAISVEICYNYTIRLNVRILLLILFKGGRKLNEETENKEKKNTFFSYKDYPLVRKGNEIYYGNMYDTTVVMMQIVEKTKVGNLDVASKIRLYQMKTDEKLNPVEAIIKQSEKNSLYEALDVAYVWLTRQS